jgi:dTMP kinase
LIYPAMTEQQQGKLIVFEGGEGCGKTTQIHLAKLWLESHVPVLTTREPGGTPLGGQIRRLLLEPAEEGMNSRTELLLYAADRAQHVERCIRPALAAGQLVLCDRYTDSTIAYQGYGRGLDRGLIDQLNHIATGGLVPDLTLWLDLDVRVGLQRAQARGQADRMERADSGFHQAVRQGFTEIAAVNPERVVRIEADRSIEDVSEAIKAAIGAAFYDQSSSFLLPRTLYTGGPA